jgi:hypothetical protein
MSFGQKKQGTSDEVPCITPKNQMKTNLYIFQKSLINQGVLKD